MLVPNGHRSLTFGDVFLLMAVLALLLVFAAQLLGCDSGPLPLMPDASTTSPAAVGDASPCPLAVHWQRCARADGQAYCWTGDPDIGSGSGTPSAVSSPPEQVTGCIVPDVAGDAVCVADCDQARPR
jgi:hypothetical protein